MAAVQQLVPALAAGPSHNTTQPGGLDALVAALSGGGHQQYLDDPSRLGAAETLQDGNGSAANDVMGMLGKFLR